MQDGLTAERTAQREDRDQQTDADGDDGLAEEDQDVPEESGSLQGGSHRVDQDQHDRQQQGQEGSERTRYALHIHMESGLIVGHLVGLLDDVAFLVGDPVELLGQVLSGVDDAGDGHGKRQDDRQQDEDTYVNSEDTADTQRAGGRGNQGVRNHQAGGQRHAQADHGLLRGPGKCLRDGGQNDEAGVTEDRDRYQESCKSQRFFFLALAEELQERVRHALRSAGHFEDLAHHHAEADDDTDTSQRAAEAACDGIDDAGA